MCSYGVRACQCPPPQQQILKFGGVYTSERCVHLRPLQESKGARLFSHQPRETHQVPKASPCPPAARHPAAPHCGAGRAARDEGYVSLVKCQRFSLIRNQRLQRKA